MAAAALAVPMRSVAAAGAAVAVVHSDQKHAPDPKVLGAAAALMSVAATPVPSVELLYSVLTEVQAQMASMQRTIQSLSTRLAAREIDGASLYSWPLSTVQHWVRTRIVALDAAQRDELCAWLCDTFGDDMDANGNAPGTTVGAQLYVWASQYSHAAVSTAAYAYVGGTAAAVSARRVPFLVSLQALKEALDGQLDREDTILSGPPSKATSHASSVVPSATSTAAPTAGNSANNTTAQVSPALDDAGDVNFVIPAALSVRSEP